MTELDFREYLETLPEPTAQDWGDRYTFTEAELPLKVQTITSQQDDPAQRQRESPKRYEVLAGLREYAAEHVLLVGKPGSGKSTALRRLLWEEAQKALSEIENGQTNFTIPVLIELRDRRQGSVVNWMQKSLRRVRISAEAIEDLLLNGRFLLLFDGVNEVPSPDVWSALDEFQRDRDFCTNPRIFTTRELGAGSDLGIEKKLKMLSLTELQMRQFIENRLPGRAENLLRQLKDRLRELAETPLLLKILCDVVQESPDGQLPQNRGELFRLEFIRRYEKFKPSHALPISGDSRRFTSELLQHLAFTMTQGDAHTDPCKPTPSWLSISRSRAEKILEDYLTDRIEAPAQNAKEWLEDLLNFKLLVVKDQEHIEFIHQLFQEYYAAEKLLGMLDDLNDDELKQDYLNYLKWTEAIALTLSLFNNETQAFRAIDCALKTDLMLSAKLVGQVKSGLQKKAIDLIITLKLPPCLNARCLGRTTSDAAIPELINIIEAHASENHWIAANMEMDKSLEVRCLAITALGEIGSESIIPSIQKLAEDKNWYIQQKANSTLKKITGEKEQHLESEVDSTIPKTFTNSDVLELLNLLDDNDFHIRRDAVEKLGNLGDKSAVAIPKLIEMLDSDTQPVVAVTLGKLGCKVVIPKLLQMLRSKDRFARMGAVIALGALEDDIAVPALLETLEDEDYKVRLYSANSLSNFDSSGQLISGLLRALEDKYRNVRWSAARSIQNLKNETVLPQLLSQIQQLCYHVGGNELIETIAAIQKRCGFYNYEIAQVAIEEGKREKGKGETEGRNITYQIGSVGNLNTGTVDVQGDQVAVKYELQQQDGECSD